MKKKENVKGNKSLAKWYIIPALAILLSLAAIGVAAGQSVSIDPASQSVSAGDTFTVDVAVDPAEYGVSSGEINIAFDADAMQADSIEPGDLLGTNPLVGTEEIDNTAGTIIYALARIGATTPPTPEGSFATITFTVDSDAPDGTYDIDITTVGLADEIFEDISGITINDGAVTVAEPDTTPPTIISVSPTGGATGVVITTTISATFSEAMNEASAKAAFSITPDVAGTFSWVWNTMTFTPDANLAYSTKYTVTIGTDAQDLAGNPMASAYSWSFTTESAPAVPTVSIDPASQSVSTGDTFTVDVVVDPAGYGVSGGEMNIAFDADAMQADSIEPGDLLGTNPLVGTEEINNTAGTIIYALARIGATAPPTPEGAFATITFTVKTDATEGTYALDIVSMGLSDENFNDIPGITINDGTVTVVTGMLYPPWDINQDGKVDYKDLGIFAATYGKSVGDPGYDARADLYGDGTIDYKDLGILAAHYGETYE